MHSNLNQFSALGYLLCLALALIIPNNAFGKANHSAPSWIEENQLLTPSILDSASDIALAQITGRVFSGYRASVIRSYWSANEIHYDQGFDDLLFLDDVDQSCRVGLSNTSVQFEIGDVYLLFLNRVLPGPETTWSNSQPLHTLVHCVMPFPVMNATLNGSLTSPFLTIDASQAYDIPYPIVEGWLLTLKTNSGNIGTVPKGVMIECPLPSGLFQSMPWDQCLTGSIERALTAGVDDPLLPTKLLMLHSSGAQIHELDWGAISCGMQASQCDSDPSVATVALHIISERDFTSAPELLSRGLYHPHGLVQQTALYELGTYPDDFVVANIRSYLEKANPLLTDRVEPCELQPFPKSNDSPYWTAVNSLLDIGSVSAVRLLEDEFSNGQAGGIEDRRRVILSVLRDRNSDVLFDFLAATYGRYDDATRMEISQYIASLGIDNFVSSLQKKYLENHHKLEGRLLPAQLLTGSALFKGNSDFVAEHMLYDPEFTVRETAQKAIIKLEDTRYLYQVIRSYIIDISQGMQLYREDTEQWLYTNSPIIQRQYLGETDPGRRTVFLAGLLIVVPNQESVLRVCLEHESGKESSRIDCTTLCHPGRIRCVRNSGLIEKCGVNEQGAIAWESVDDCRQKGCSEIPRSDVCSSEGISPDIGDLVFPQHFASLQCEDETLETIAVCNQCTIGDDWSRCINDDYRQSCGVDTGFQIVNNRCEQELKCLTLDKNSAECGYNEAIP